MIKHYGGEGFENLVAEGITVVDFYADWCGPCAMLAPELEKLVKENTEVQVLKIDTDSHSAIAQDFGVTAIPTVLLFKDGKKLKETKGYMTFEQLKTFVQV